MSDYITDPNSLRDNKTFFIGRVVSIILGPWDPLYKNSSDLGKIIFQQLYSPSGKRRKNKTSSSGNKPAYPMWGSFKQYPVVNELVLITTGPSDGLNDSYSSQKLYYLPPYALWNDSNHNGFPDLEDYSNQLNATANTPGNAGSANPSSLYLGFTFNEKEIKNLQPFEGDIIVQSRFGQSMRFGSTVSGLKNTNTWSSYGSNGDPITIITNQQNEKATESNLAKFDSIVEDINQDGSSIYMTSTQQIYIKDLAENVFPLKSFEISVSPSTQVVLDSPLPFPISNYATSADSQDAQALSNNSATAESSNTLENQNRFSPEFD